VSRLAIRALLGLAELAAAMGLALFFAAGTVDYWQGWLYLILFVGSAAWITAWLWRHDRALLARRVSAGARAETERTQKWIQALMGLAFVALLAIPALDRRGQAPPVPVAISLAGDVLVLAGFRVVFLVFRSNTFAAATIAIAADQKVISTGLYAIVRHPMYAGALVLLLGTPLALGSWRGLWLVVPMIAVLAWRLLDEERYLIKNLAGYRDYCARVPYRLAPGVW
jgi:protein-S-isoprenylcysteine O-methyltransferase Ste14